MTTIFFPLSTKMSRFGGKTCSNHDVTPNEYEQQRMKTIEANKIKMQTLGIKRIATSMTSLADSSKAKKTQKNHDATLEKDNDYVPDKNEEIDCEEKVHIVTTNKKVLSYLILLLLLMLYLLYLLLGYMEEPLFALVTYLLKKTQILYARDCKHK